MPLREVNEFKLHLPDDSRIKGGFQARVNATSRIRQLCMTADGGQELLLGRNKTGGTFLILKYAENNFLVGVRQPEADEMWKLATVDGVILLDGGWGAHAERRTEMGSENHVHTFTIRGRTGQLGAMGETVPGDEVIFQFGIRPDAFEDMGKEKLGRPVKKLRHEIHLASTTGNAVTLWLDQYRDQYDGRWIAGIDLENGTAIATDTDGRPRFEGDGRVYSENGKTFVVLPEALAGSAIVTDHPQLRSAALALADSWLDLHRGIGAERALP